MKQEADNKSSLFSPDLAPVSLENRTWNTWNLAALWVGMAVCIPTYLLASYMIRSGLSWQAALIIVGLANLVITIPMVLNGHAGVKYGIPFPVVGRSAFGIYGIHLPSLVRGFVACGWFGIQTWIGGLAIYSIWNALTGSASENGLSAAKFLCFGIFWLINIYFIWKGTESIKWLEDFSAPILIGIGIVLIYWGYSVGGSFGQVLDESFRLGQATVIWNEDKSITLNPLLSDDGNLRANEFRVVYFDRSGTEMETAWMPVLSAVQKVQVDTLTGIDMIKNNQTNADVFVQFRAFNKGKESISSKVKAASMDDQAESGSLWSYLLWFTSMVGFWATMSLSISDITRFAKSQKDQIAGQFIGLPGTMIFYSFAGIFVTSAAVIAFKDILISEDAPWDPVSLMDRFENPVIIIFAQLAMLIATLSTNIAANVIAPANAISNVFPKQVSFRVGGVISGLIGIVLCPWWLMDDISSILIFISGLLGPVLAILLCDYFLIRKTELSIEDLYKVQGKYTYTYGFNLSALVAIVMGALFAVAGKWIPALSWAYSLSWFSGFFLAFVLYYLLMKFQTKQS